METAFAELVGIATRLAERGKPPRAAAVKAALLIRADPPFDEARLGFPKFMAFLKAAEAAGHVELRPAAVGPDVDVVPRGVVVPVPESADARMRSDVWDAFTRWDRGFVRFWDRVKERAYRIELDSSSTEPVTVARVRRERGENPDRFVPIENVPVESVVEWAKQFASEQESAASAELRASLEGALPVRDFTVAVRRLGLVPAWHRAHLQSVRQVVTEWATRHGIDLDLSAEPPAEMKVGTTASGDKSRFVRSGSESGSAEDLLRQRLHQWIDGMTLPEMMSIPVPVRLLDFSKQ